MTVEAEPRFGRIFEGKKVLITGATRGLGLDTAAAFLAEGAHVVGLGRDQRRLAKLSGLGERVTALATEITDPRSLQTTLDLATADGEPFDTFVHAASFSTPNAIVGTDFEKVARNWHKITEPTLMGAFLLGAAAIQYLRPDSGGASSLIFFSSRLTVPHSRQATSQSGIYASAKAGLENLTKTLASDLGPHGIRVNAISPGHIKDDSLEPEQQVRVAALFRRFTAMDRLATPDDVTNGVLYLASPLSLGTTGHVLPVDGGGPYHGAPA